MTAAAGEDAASPAALSAWRLRCVRGRQVWEHSPTFAGSVAELATNAVRGEEDNYGPDAGPGAGASTGGLAPEGGQSLVERYLTGTGGPSVADTRLPDETAETGPVRGSGGGVVARAMRRAVNFWRLLQVEDGHWPMDYGGPMFLLPGLVIASYITGVEMGAAHRAQILRYLGNQQREDGGWGLHIESPSTMFGTAMNYVCCRLLGLGPDEPVATRARDWIHRQGGAQTIPSWGKFWLAALGVYEWDGVNPLPPEMWLLPYWLPIHPGRFWCHCRIVYLPMSYIFGRRATYPLDDLTRALRVELYPQGYDSINWPEQKWACCSLDMYYPPRWFLKLMYFFLSLYERFRPAGLRQRALKEAMRQIDAEDASTKYICIGPVSKGINMMCTFYEYGKESTQFRMHKERLADYLWLGTDGMKMQGYNGSQLWDAAFALQAIKESGLYKDEDDDEDKDVGASGAAAAAGALKKEEGGDGIATAADYREVLVRGMAFIKCAQVMEDSGDDFYRHPSLGAWPFSTVDHGWPISDCTAEGIKTALVLSDLDFIEPLEDQRLFHAINVVLSLQNPSGGWASYELKRGPSALELLNPSEVFRDIIVEYPYVECSSASIQALVTFKEHYPDHRSAEIARAIDRGVSFIKSIQRDDGSWIGSWGVCFTYGTWFGVEGLLAAGVPADSPTVQRACKFLLSKQRADGGWGEDFRSCVERRWVEHETSQVVNTAWALMTLLKAHYPAPAALRRAARFLVARQLDNGDYEQEGISGVFNANCAISYSSYKNSFSIWALARFNNTYPDGGPGDGDDGDEQDTGGKSKDV